MADEYNVIIDGKKLKEYPRFDECYVDQDGNLWTVSSGKLEQTRESWEKRKVRELVEPQRIVPKSNGLEKLARQIAIHMRRQDIDPTKYHRKDVFIKAVTEINGKKEGSTKALGNLWRAGYMERMGSTYGQTGRPFNTRWRVSPDYAGKPQNNITQI